MNLKLEWQKLDYVWLGLTIAISLILSYGVFNHWFLTFLMLLILGILLLLINDFKISVFLILLSIIPGQLLRLGVAEYGGSVIASDLIVILVIVIWLVKKTVKKERISKTPINLFLVFFAMFAIISLLFSLNLILPIESLKASLYLVRFLAYTGIFYLVLDLTRDEKKAIKYWQWVIGVALAVAILGFVQLVYVPDFAFMAQFGWDPHENRLLSTFFDPNLLGGFLGFIIILILGIVFLSVSRKQKISLLVIALVIFIALILTFSRSGYLGFIVGFILVSLLKSWKMTVTGILIVVLGLSFSSRALDRIKSAWSLDETAEARIESWQQGWEIISDHPVVGIGFNTLAYVKPNYYFYERDVRAHSAAGIDSSFLTLWATSGIIGLILYLIIYGIIVWQSFRTYLDQKQSKFIRGFSLGLGAALIGLLIHSQFVNSLLYPPMMILIWFCAGLLFSFSDKTIRLLKRGKN